MPNETVKFRIDGMNCKSCEKVITKVVESMPGVSKIEVNYEDGSGTVEYDPSKANLEDVFGRLSENGFECRLPGEKMSRVRSAIFSILLVLIGVFLISGNFFDVPIPAVDQDTSILLVFALGIVTGFHCIAMCGGFVVSYSSKDAGKGAAAHLTYGLAKTFSYVFFGALFGLIGSFIAFTPQLRGLAAAVAGVFLILFGLNMLGMLPFRISRLSILGKFPGKHSSPIVLGLLNGLMFACGPLQAMYVMAAASGSAYYGALYLGVFGLGTLPMLLGFGFLTSIISSRMTRKILRYSGVIVIILGVVMLNRGMLLAGNGYDLGSLLGSKPADTPSLNVTDVQVIYMNVTRYGWEPNTFVLKKGVPVKWVINGKEITGCNNAIQVPKLGLEFKIKPGEQVIEFTPNESGVIPWSCWMGMIDGKFIVEDGGQ